MKRAIGSVAVSLGIAAALIIFWGIIATKLATFFGFNNGGGNGSHYLFWSGSGSDLGYYSLVAGVVVLYRSHNCKYRWCPFLGHYDFTDPADGVTRKLCWLHHPDVKHKTLKAEHVEEIQGRRREHLQEKFHLYVGDKPGKG